MVCELPGEAVAKGVDALVVVLLEVSSLFDRFVVVERVYDDCKIFDGKSEIHFFGLDLRSVYSTSVPSTSTSNLTPKASAVWAKTLAT